MSTVLSFTRRGGRGSTPETIAKCAIFQRMRRWAMLPSSIPWLSSALRRVRCRERPRNRTFLAFPAVQRVRFRGLRESFLPSSSARKKSEWRVRITARFVRLASGPWAACFPAERHFIFEKQLRLLWLGLATISRPIRRPLKHSHSSFEGFSDGFRR